MTIVTAMPEISNKKIVLKNKVLKSTKVLDIRDIEIGPKIIVKKKISAKKNSLCNVVKLIIITDYKHDDIPANIGIIKEYGYRELSLGEKIISGRIYSIMAVGQAINDWVRKIGPIWITSDLESNIWHKVKTKD